MNFTAQEIEVNRKAFTDRMRAYHEAGEEPGIGILTSEDAPDCVQGVACEVFIKDTDRGECRMWQDTDPKDSEPWGYEIDGRFYTKHAPFVVGDWLGLPFWVLGELQEMNDYQYYDFSMLVELAEERFARFPADCVEGIENTMEHVHQAEMPTPHGYLNDSGRCDGHALIV